MNPQIKPDRPAGAEVMKILSQNYAVLLLRPTLSAYKSHLICLLRSQQSVILVSVACPDR